MYAISDLSCSTKLLYCLIKCYISNGVLNKRSTGTVSNRVFFIVVCYYYITKFCLLETPNVVFQGLSKRLCLHSDYFKLTTVANLCALSLVTNHTYILLHNRSIVAYLAFSAHILYISHTSCPFRTIQCLLLVFDCIRLK